MNRRNFLQSIGRGVLGIAFVGGVIVKKGNSSAPAKPADPVVKAYYNKMLARPPASKLFDLDQKGMMGWKMMCTYGIMNDKNIQCLAIGEYAKGEKPAGK